LTIQQFRILLSILSAVLITLAFMPFYLGPLIFIAFIPLLFALDNIKKISYGFLCALLTLFTAYLISYSMNGVFTVPFRAMDMTIIVIVVLFFSFLMAIPFLLFLWTKKVIKQEMIAYLSLSFYYSAYEYLDSFSELSLPISNLTHTLSQYPLLIQFYAYTSPLGGTFLIMIINVLIYLLLKHWSNSSKRKLHLGIIGGVLLLTAILNISSLLSNRSKPNKQKIKVAVLQPSFDTYEEINKEVTLRNLQTLKQMTLSVKDSMVDLIIWHEGAIQGHRLLLNNIEKDGVVLYLKKLSKQMNAPILVGTMVFKVFTDERLMTESTRPTGDGRYYEVYNTALLIAHDSPTQIYFKYRLLPFVERVPFLSTFSFLENLHIDLGINYPSYGKIYNPKPLKYKNLRIAPIICNEELYPDYIRTFVEKKANLIASISNDAWIGPHYGYLQTANTSIPLSIATGTSLARSSNSGSSLFTDKYGKISDMTEYGEKTVIVKEIELGSSKTFYVKYGNLLGKAAVFISGILIIINGMLFFMKLRK